MEAVFVNNRLLRCCVFPSCSLFFDIYMVLFAFSEGLFGKSAYFCDTDRERNERGKQSKHRKTVQGELFVVVRLCVSDDKRY